MKKKTFLTVVAADRSIPWYLAGDIPLANVMAVWQPRGAASLAASYLRIAGSVGNANLDPAVVGGTAPAWDGTNGWKGGSLAYLKTGLSMAVAGLWSMVIRFSNAASSNTQAICGTLSDDKMMGLRPNRVAGDLLAYLRSSTNDGGAGDAMASGVFAFSGGDAYINGVLHDDVTDATATINDFYLLAAEYLTAAAAHSTGYIQAIAFYDTPLTAPQVVAVTAAMNAINPT